jgi:hypothetical protein
VKRATHDTDVISTEKGEPIGFNLGWDHCAEHEWGIKDIKRGLGIAPASNLEPKDFGLRARTITNYPEQNILFSVDRKRKYTYLVYKDYMWDRPKYQDILCWAGVHKFDTGLVTAWSDRGFGIFVPKENKEGVALLKKLHQAFKEKDVAVFFGGNNNPFANAGLIICIASKLSEEVKEAMYEADKDRYELLEAVSSTGIEKRLKAAGKKYFALSPRWKDKEKTELQFWLNPMEQRHNNYGWFTVSELDQWIRETGPIPRKQKNP